MTIEAEALKTVPDIIKAASGTNLGILALLVLVLALFGFVYFRRSRAVYQFAVFVLMFFGVAAFAFAAISVQRDEALRRIDAERAKSDDAKTIRDLTLKLNFVGNAPVANPWTAKVSPWVQKQDESQEKLLTDVDVMKGVGGIAVFFRQLNVGDKLYLVVEDGALKWRSDDMRMLEAQLNLNRQ